MLKNNLSLIRFGDGEINLFSGENIYFQDYLSKIYDDFLKITQNSKNNVLISIPDALGTLKNKPLYIRWHWVSHIKKQKKSYKILFNRNLTYGNAHFSRPYTDIKDYNRSKSYFKKIKELWEDKRLLIVEGEFTRNGYKNDLFNNSKDLQRIICPSENAYNYIPEIKNQILDFFCHDLILFSLGPASKIIIHELSSLNYICIDIGHLDSEYEWFLKRDNLKKTKFSHKHTADIKDNNILEVSDSEYLKSILVEIN